MKIPVYNCIIEEELSDETGIYAISFVDSPANEVEFVALGEQAQPQYLSRDTQKQILTGVVLKPDQLIYRNSPQIGEHYIRFSSEQIEKIAQKMMRTGIALNTTTHQHHQPLDGNYLVELWIVEDPERDKSRALGFANLPQGTLMCSYKIEDRKYWDEQVMAGHIRGFSLEGLFNQQIAMNKHINHSKQKDGTMNKKPKETLLQRVRRVLLDIENVTRADATASGEAFVLFTLADGKEVRIDQDGFATIDGSQAPAGEHKLANGNLLVIDGQGQFVETKESSDKVAGPDEKTAIQTLNARRQRMSEVKPEFVEALKAKVAEMQTIIDALTQALDEAQGTAKEAVEEMDKLRRQTPSARPATHQASNLSTKDMTTSERLAVALSQSIQRRK
jgi:hypothetical protein